MCQMVKCYNIEDSLLSLQKTKIMPVGQTQVFGEVFEETVSV